MGGKTREWGHSFLKKGTILQPLSLFLLHQLLLLEEGKNDFANLFSRVFLDEVPSCHGFGDLVVVPGLGLLEDEGGEEAGLCVHKELREGGGAHDAFVVADGVDNGGRLCCDGNLSGPFQQLLA